ADDVDRLVKRTSTAGKLVMQSLRHAGRKRELDLAMEPGTETTFDPALHRSDDAPQPGDRVRIRTPPIGFSQRRAFSLCLVSMPTGGQMRVGRELRCFSGPSPG